ncbi:armadillo-type protein [Globomyces pollinis-pini]|nr:armadillo-type protein [Globomyces pollinis-pini]
MSDIDSDFRYMAANDLFNELIKPDFLLDLKTESKVADAVLKALNDSNSEVQNMSIKCITPLVKKLSNIPYFANVLVLRLDTETGSLRDIAASSLKILIQEIPPKNESLPKLLESVIPKLLDHLQKDVNFELDVIDILSDIFKSYGSIIKHLSKSAELQSKTLNCLLKLLDHPRPVVRKRTITCVGMFTTMLSPELFTLTSNSLIDDLKTKANAEDYQKLLTTLSCLSTICQVNPEAMAPIVDDLIQLSLSYSKFDDDDLKDQCLQSLDSFLQFSPRIENIISPIIELALELVKYDPNYDDDDDEVEDMDVDEEEDDGDEEEYSDDEDVSWKVRRAASKLLSSIVKKFPVVLPEYYKLVMPLLIKRFNEREESVRVDIIQCVGTIVEETGKTSRLDTSTLYHESKKRKGSDGGLVSSFNTPQFEERQMLQKMIPDLINALSKQFQKSSINTTESGVILLKQLVLVTKSGLETSLGIILPQILSLLSNDKLYNSGNTNTNIKIEVLDLLVCLLETNQENCLHLNDSATLFVDAVSRATQDTFYKVRVSAMTVAGLLIQVLRPKYENEFVQITPDRVQLVQRLYDYVWNLLQEDELESEVTEKAIATLGEIVSQAGDLLPENLLTSSILPQLLVRLKIEATRLVTIQSLSTIFSSSLLRALKHDGLIDFIPEVQSLITKAHRPTATASVQCLITLFSICENSIPFELYSTTLNSINQVLGYTIDTLILPTLFDLLAILVVRGMQDPEFLGTLQGDTIPKIIEIMVNQSHVVSGGHGLTSLLALWRVMCLQHNQFQTYNYAIKPLMIAAQNDSAKISKESFLVLAKCIGTATNIPESSTLVQEMIRVADGSAGEALQRFSLLCLGRLGLEIDMAQMAPNLYPMITQFIESGSDELKNTSVFVLGHIAIGNVSFYLPKILSSIENRSFVYLHLLALHEMIVQANLCKSMDTFKSFSQPIWNLLFNLPGTVSKEAGLLNVTAECLGKLCLTNLGIFLPQLQSQIQSPIPEVRQTAVSTFRFTLVSTDEHYHETIQSMSIQFLRLIGDSDLVVRRMGLSTLHAIAHSKPRLLVTILPEVLQMLYVETQFKEELIEIVEMGPFKHKVDTGLDTRKIAFECMSIIFDHLCSSISISDFSLHIIRGLSDPANEIKIICQQILIKLIDQYPSIIRTSMTAIVVALKASTFVRIKATAIKQDIEQSQTLILSSLKTIRHGSTIFDHGDWKGLVDEVLACVGTDDLPNLKELYLKLN